MTAKYIFGGIVIIACYITGNLYINTIKQKITGADDLLNALFLLKMQICTYSCGLTPALRYVNKNTDCPVFVEMEGMLSSGDEPQNAVDNTELSPQVRSMLKKLLECILLGDDDEILKAFSSTIEIVENDKHTLDDKYKMEAPLYRKLSLLLGISIFILLL